MGTILLRTMTVKSKVEYGRYKDLTIGDVLRKSKLGLLYIYFNYELLTFTDEILKELKIRPEDVIKKPGKNPEKYSYYENRNRFIQARMKADKEDSPGVVHCIMHNINKGRNRAHYKGLIQREKISYSKESLQRKNQGH